MKESSIKLSAFLLLLLTFFSFSATSTRAPLTEYEVKAAYLYNFIKFVQWPQKAFSDSLDPIVIGIIGDDAFDDILRVLAEEKTVHSRNLEIRKYEHYEDIRNCHVLYISSIERRYQVSILQRMHRKWVLTVGNVEYFTRIGGIINFINEKDHVGFEINMTELQKSGLEMSSQILKLATLIRK